MTEFNIFKTAADTDKQGNLWPKIADSSLGFGRSCRPAHTNFCHSYMPGTVVSSKVAIPMTVP
jgi:hypothetical protein